MGNPKKHEWELFRFAGIFHLNAHPVMPSMVLVCRSVRNQSKFDSQVAVTTSEPCFTTATTCLRTALLFFLSNSNKALFSSPELPCNDQNEQVHLDVIQETYLISCLRKLG
mmetsp:Transcript_33255/g.130918  ORF Transcript_33255/g.130918 Transcript_33255/m.130918 type:complete len:111 (+) Transcript_33255:2034-2366(+)